MKLTWPLFKAMNTPTEWRARFTRNRWIIAWTGVALLFAFMVAGGWIFADRIWQGAFMQTLATAVPIYAAILIYLQSKAAGDRAMREQLDHMQALTREQIKALTDNTNRQISEYSRETMRVVHKLEDHSALLAALMKRELEKAIADHNANVNEANRQMRKILGFQLGRTNAERHQQIVTQQNFLQELHRWGEYIQDRFQQLTIEHNPKY